MHPRIEKFLLGSCFAGIEAEFRGDEMRYHVTLVKQKGKKITVDLCACNLASLSDLPAGILKNIPVMLAITGKGILYRKVQADRDAGIDVLVRKALPNISAKDFITEAQSAGSEHYLAIARKETVVRALDEVSAHGSVISISIGALCVKNILPLLAEEMVSFGAHRVDHDRRLIASVQYNETHDGAADIHLGDEMINAQHVIGFSAVITRLVNAQLQTSLLNTDVFLQQRLFKISVRAAIIFFLIILSFNFIAFSHYHNRAEELQSLPGSGNVLTERLHVLRSEVNTRQSFLQASGLLREMPFAWYADQLAHGLPSGIQLKQMHFCPRVKLAEEDTIGFSTNQLEITGTCAESTDLNKWLQQLKAVNWVKSAAIQSYGQDRSRTYGEFKLELQL